ncbi:Clp protease N-terminal domain-containing protein [Nonomuraea sp. NPDC003804]|uniref:Clp protease N-terminal domain-containing protein n=1 Tax=Nonomuraea sp. NPDC003804 TaxID=3154547 RepID=UPI0033A3BEFF
MFSMFERFTEPARRAVMRAGILSMDAGRTALAPDLMLLGLAEEHPLPHLPAAEALRPHLDTGRTRELLAAIGIDVDEVRRRTRHGADDPARWRLGRSRVNPLRLTLSGPLGMLALEPHARKVIEVAMWKPGPVTGERLLWGLLADGADGTAALLRRCGADVPALVRAAGIPVHRPRRTA